MLSVQVRLKRTTITEYKYRILYKKKRLPSIPQFPTKETKFIEVKCIFLKPQPKALNFRQTSV